MNNTFIPAKQAKEMLGVGDTTLWRLARDKILDKRKAGHKTVYYSLQSINRYMSGEYRLSK
ncbi:helix-turn-helix transcriptional regulator [Campylobacter pinnipediorum]|uniref:helix-turn-helix transcriptional regulator n=1 Tax=Campylobacter pinnipediorum TaxID=1965231 RepID=UPI000995D729|nr:helix-turn-helix domain-containing protein [Campylobacter pinnipediorum]